MNTFFTEKSHNFTLVYPEINVQGIRTFISPLKLYKGLYKFAW